MQKLLAQYKLDPSDTNKAKLIKYSNKHMMAICLLPLEDQQFLKALGV
jgi:hypothetical protein